MCDINIAPYLRPLQVLLLPHQSSKLKAHLLLSVSGASPTLNSPSFPRSVAVRHTPLTHIEQPRYAPSRETGQSFMVSSVPLPMVPSHISMSGRVMRDTTVPISSMIPVNIFSDVDDEYDDDDDDDVVVDE